MPETPEQRARREIDADLTAADWRVQDKDAIDLTAGRGIAVREFKLKPGFGFADYLRYLDRKALGAVEAKAEGTLTGVELSRQSTRRACPTTSLPMFVLSRFSSSRMARSPILPMVSTPCRDAGKSSTFRARKPLPDS